jgi:chromosome segregation ATPase
MLKQKIAALEAAADPAKIENLKNERDDVKAKVTALEKRVKEAYEKIMFTPSLCSGAEELDTLEDAVTFILETWKRTSTALLNFSATVTGEAERAKGLEADLGRAEKKNKQLETEEFHLRHNLDDAL